MSEDSDFQTGHEFPSQTLTFTPQQLQEYARISADHNPIHLDVQAARVLGLDHIVVHGMLSMASTCNYVQQCYPQGSFIASVKFRFSHPVYVVNGDRAEIRLSAKITKSDQGLHTVAVEALSEDKKVFSRAEVIIRPANELGTLSNN